VNQPRLIGRVAFLTGSAEADAHGALHATGCPILPKPFEIVELKRLVEEWEGADRSAPSTDEGLGRSE
jgi:hypothetical protein